MRQSVRVQILPRQAPQVHSMRRPRRPQVPMSLVLAIVRETRPFTHPYIARSREAPSTQVLGVRQELLAVVVAQQAHACAQRRATLQVRLLQQGIHCL